MEKNIYLQEFDIPQIVLFYEMLKAYPQVAVSHELANQYILDCIGDRNELTIFDIGIGKGKQIESLIKSIQKENKQIEMINIIGLDPDPMNLKDSEKKFKELAATVPIILNFFPICNFIEKLPDEKLTWIKNIASNNLFINSALAFHHITHPLGDYDYRTKIIERLKKLNPVLFTLIEPNSNHDIEVLSKRFHNSWNHFSIVFELIDESGIKPEHKYLIKEKFFGREIRDMFSVSDYLRCERHETVESWILRLSKAGLKPYKYDNIQARMPEYCQVNIEDGCIDLGYKSVPLVGVLAYW